MKWLLLGIVTSVGVIGLGLILDKVKADNQALSDWNSNERRAMMIKAQEEQDEDLGFV